MRPSFPFVGKSGIGPGSRDAFPGDNLLCGCPQSGGQVADGFWAAFRQIVPAQAFDLRNSFPRELQRLAGGLAWLDRVGVKPGIFAFQAPQELSGVNGSPGCRVGTGTFKGSRP
jgi:hypothetical protein